MSFSTDQNVSNFLKGLQTPDRERLIRNCALTFRLQRGTEDELDNDWKIYNLSDFMESLTSYSNNHPRCASALCFFSVLNRLQRDFPFHPETHEIVYRAPSARNGDDEQVMDANSFTSVLVNSVNDYFQFPQVPGLVPVWGQVIHFAIRPRRAQPMVRPAAILPIQSPVQSPEERAHRADPGSTTPGHGGGSNDDNTAVIILPTKPGVKFECTLHGAPESVPATQCPGKQAVPANLQEYIGGDRVIIRLVSEPGGRMGFGYEAVEPRR